MTYNITQYSIILSYFYFYETELTTKKSLYKHPNPAEEHRQRLLANDMGTQCKHHCHGNTILGQYVEKKRAF